MPSHLCPNCNEQLFHPYVECELCGWVSEAKCKYWDECGQIYRLKYCDTTCKFYKPERKCKIWSSCALYSQKHCADCVEEIFTG